MIRRLISHLVVKVNGKVRVPSNNFYALRYFLDDNAHSNHDVLALDRENGTFVHEINAQRIIGE